ncbi:hypothetical protein BFO01nite_04860 [Brevibacillus formosus]|uniref:Uncharacterized protein n=1 Tax=Brevibacillus formosus TaxID=54913 RepID=A0ABQ0T2K7_9BACL|nr:hypothetical protein C7R91_14925 [Brevibacillus formosus]GED56354.1 hypothetical protein BFO01nite_04860 [Brevibacillus formosus]
MFTAPWEFFVECKSDYCEKYEVYEEGFKMKMITLCGSTKFKKEFEQADLLSDIHMQKQR